MLLGYSSIRNNRQTSETGGQFDKCEKHWCKTAKDMFKKTYIKRQRPKDRKDFLAMYH